MADKGKEKLSFIEDARRKQIIESAIETIAAQGYQRATLDLIAENVNVTKGVITYHFANKDELIECVMERILQEQRQHREARVSAGSSAWEKLQAFIQADIDFFTTFPQFQTALVELWGSITTRDEKKAFENSAYRPPHLLLEGILRQGLSDGLFTDFNSTETAAVIIAMLDGLMVQQVFTGGQLDMQKCGQEVIRFCRQSLLQPDYDTH